MANDFLNPTGPMESMWRKNRDIGGLSGGGVLNRNFPMTPYQQAGLGLGPGFTPAQTPPPGGWPSASQLNQMLGIPIAPTTGSDYTNPTGPMPSMWRQNRDIGGQAGGGVFNRGFPMIPGTGPGRYETQMMGANNILGGSPTMQQQQPGYNLDDWLKGVQQPAPTSGPVGSNPYGGGNAFGGGFGNIVRQLMQKYYGGGM